MPGPGRLARDDRESSRGNQAVVPRRSHSGLDGAAVSVGESLGSPVFSPRASEATPTTSVDDQPLVPQRSDRSCGLSELPSRTGERENRLGDGLGDALRFGCVSPRATSLCRRWRSRRLITDPVSPGSTARTEYTGRFRVRLRLRRWCAASSMLHLAHAVHGPRPRR